MYIVFVFYKRGDGDHAEDDEKRDSEWLQNFSLLSVNNLQSWEGY